MLCAHCERTRKLDRFVDLFVPGFLSAFVISVVTIFLVAISMSIAKGFKVDWDGMVILRLTDGRVVESKTIRDVENLDTVCAVGR